MTDGIVFDAADTRWITPLPRRLSSTTFDNGYLLLYDHDGTVVKFVWRGGQWVRWPRPRPWKLTNAQLRKARRQR